MKTVRLIAAALILVSVPAVPQLMSGVGLLKPGSSASAPLGPSPGGFLKEDSGYILLESGSYLLTET